MVLYWDAARLASEQKVAQQRLQEWKKKKPATEAPQEAATKKHRVDIDAGKEEKGNKKTDEHKKSS